MWWTIRPPRAGLRPPKTFAPSARFSDLEPGWPVYALDRPLRAAPGKRRSLRSVLLDPLSEGSARPAPGKSPATCLAGHILPRRSGRATDRACGAAGGRLGQNDERRAVFPAQRAGGAPVAAVRRAPRRGSRRASRPPKIGKRHDVEEFCPAAELAREGARPLRGGCGRSRLSGAS